MHLLKRFILQPRIGRLGEPSCSSFTPLTLPDSEVVKEDQKHPCSALVLCRSFRFPSRLSRIAHLTFSYINATVGNDFLVSRLQT